LPVYLPGLTFGVGYGGASYGYSPYGSGAFPRLPVPTTGGYGGAPYGLSPYGSLDVIPPRVTGASSLDGFRIEIFFSEAMAANAALTLAANYTLGTTHGVPLTAQSVVGATPGSSGGYTSVILTHSGSTLGGQYNVAVNNVEDLAGNPVLVTTTGFLARGDATSVNVSLEVPDDGRTVQLDFLNSLGNPQPLLTEAEFTPGVDSTASYAVTTTYPVAPTLGSATQEAALSSVLLDVHPMTSAQYDLMVGPALSVAYTGSTLPDDSTTFTGIELGTGTSAASVGGLFLSKANPDLYGWRFLDTTGRVLPNTTYRADLSIDTSTATVVPAVFNSTFAVFSVSDGAVQVDITLEDIAGMKMLRVTSGGALGSAPADWGTGGAQISLVRNQKGGLYSLLFQGVPLLTFPLASATGAPTFAGGVTFTLQGGHQVSLLKVSDVDLTASSTLFTDAWNFIHNYPKTFTGSSVLTRDRIITKRGPLVRGWGDATPATKEDVEVRLDGGVVDLVGVNPYVGEIYPLLPIPLAASGTFTVAIDYIWFMTPVMEMAGLNTRGLVLNVWDQAVGHTPGAVSPTPASSTGTTKDNRFPLAISLPLGERRSPKLIGHRYIGFQKGGYSALLNEPTTLQLNKDPHAISEGGVSAAAMAERGAFNGQTSPQNSATPWILDGTDGGAVVGDGTYRVIDASSGPYGVGTAAVYKRDLDLSLTTSTNNIARLKVETYVADGVFTGVGFGLHDGGHLILIGALRVGGVQHVGILTDGASPQLEASWKIGPAAPATAISKSVVTIPFENLPQGFDNGGRFRVASGPQAGVYTVAECGAVLVDGTVTLEVTPSLPADPSLFGNNEFEALFEVPWSVSLVSLRFESVFPGGSVHAYVGGAISGSIGVLTEAPAYPAQTALLLPATEKGVSFWGSVSRRAESSSVWDLALYDSFPEKALQTVQGLTALTEMNTLPEDDPNDPWYIVGGFGYSAEDAGGDDVLIKSTSASSTIGLTFSYQRVEPFLNPKTYTDLETEFRVESGRLGVGDVDVIINDSKREVELRTLLYVQGTHTSPSTGLGVNNRALVTDLPEASLSGLQEPVEAGWTTASSSGSPTMFVRGQTLKFSKGTLDQVLWSKVLPASVMVLEEGQILEARVSIEAGAVGGSGVGGIGLLLQGRALGPAAVARPVGLGFNAAGVILLSETFGEVAAFAFDWTDGKAHTYRVTVDPIADIVVLVIDDVVIGNTPWTGFSPAAADSTAKAMFGAVSDGTFQATLHSASVIPLRVMPPTVKSTVGRTFGVRLRDTTGLDIDSYRIPRSDATPNVLNSSLLSTPVEMDWQAYCKCRLYLDPTWGVSFYRPDLPLPPGADGDFATETTDPSAAWVNVEYRELPVKPEARGSVEFGSPSPTAVTQSRWAFMRYRIRGDYDGFGIAPQNMVLNRAFKITSGEFLIDDTPEVYTITSRTATEVVVSDSAVYADRVFVVQVGGVVLASSGWSFEATTQALTLTVPLPLAQYPVTVTFAPGKPITKTYLCSQPIEGSVTLLNEGTPPFPKSQDDATTREVEFGSKINDPSDVLDDAESLVLNDPHRYVNFKDTAASRYAGMEYCEVVDGDSVHITPICDAPGPGHGLAAIGIEGAMTSDSFTVPGGPAGKWAGQSPVIKGSSTHFNQTSVLMASGGNYVEGHLGPGTAVTYPNARNANWDPLPAGSQMGMNQDTRFLVEDVSPRTEDWDLAGLMGDNVPATSADPATDPNPDGVPGTELHGAVAYIQDDTSSSPFSRLGPWSGLPALSVRSLLAGGGQLNGTQFTLQGGAQLDVVTVRTTGVIQAAN
jgi:hypothetical protein